MRWKLTILIGLCAWLGGAAAFAARPLVGTDLTIDYHALRTIEQQAEAGDADAQFELYNLYGLKADYVRAYEWLEKAADNGHKEALRWSFMRYDDGGNFSYYRQTIDYSKAFRRLKQLEVADPEAAWFNLGIYYRYGKGVKRDNAQAIHYFRLRADPNRSEDFPDYWAQIELGRMYAEGLGVKRDDINAYVWFGLGTEQWLQFRHHPGIALIDYVGPSPEDAMGEKLSAYREKLRRRLTSAQIQIAKGRMKAFREKHPLEPCLILLCEPSEPSIIRPPEIKR